MTLKDLPFGGSHVYHVSQKVCLSAVCESRIVIISGEVGRCENGHLVDLDELQELFPEDETPIEFEEIKK
ncbi:hypothetical protein A3F08_02800 [Candidatus Berkelbacteria bacterium RIFCSPHIGHO2_12_FULL_36_9]|uniref:Uncharacterized protein n=1 Tax=Candidatus Berkelbacteria bacterium RIFCSPHIGHO2_12_FULL_36_9 TaxID=1797469 RepID=A0A1F5EDY9_9BACT|nr:MAG: hypothetical protein A3F08_02800 [Candidatus Berkelbacteria bacterium RIFCSPHIGHO2_12_FULL_36_9]